MQLIHPPHHRQVIWAYRRWPVIMRRACDLQQTALPHHRQHRVSMVHQCQSVRRAHGPDLLRKKSRSTVSWPIFSNRGASCASLAAPSSFPLEDPRAKSDAMPSSNVFRHAWIWLACTPNRLDSSATVPSSRTAASATFALNSAPCFLRVFPMSHLRPTGRSKGRLSLNNLSSFRGPPQFCVVSCPSYFRSGENGHEIRLLHHERQCFLRNIRAKAARSVNQANINATILRGSSIRFPRDISEQQRIADMLDELTRATGHLRAVYATKLSRGMSRSLLKLSWRRCPP